MALPYKTVQVAGNSASHTFPTVAVAGLVRPAPVSGRYFALTTAQQVNTAITAAGQLYFFPFLMPFDFNFSGAATRLYTAGAGSSVKSAIWANSSISNRPVGAPLYADNTGIATTGAAGDQAITMGPGTLTAGFYWGGVVCTGTPPAISSIQSNTLLRFMMGSTTVLGSVLQLAQTYANPMPTLAEGTSFTDNNSVSPIFDLIAQ